MNEELYGLTEDGELIDNDCGRVYMVKGISAVALCDELNGLISENQKLYNKLDELNKKYERTLVFINTFYYLVNTKIDELAELNINENTTYDFLLELINELGRIYYE